MSEQSKLHVTNVIEELLKTLIDTHQHIWRRISRKLVAT